MRTLFSIRRGAASFIEKKMGGTMPQISVNWWAILAAVTANFVIGGVWYSPVLFAKPWLEMAGVGKRKFDAGLPIALLVDLVSSFLIAFVLVHAIRYAGAHDFGSGLFVAFWIWLAFVATVLIASVTYEHKPFKYFAINAGFRFVAIMVMAAILTLWK
jgi:Protein of unknown function (DUF1761)